MLLDQSRTNVHVPTAKYASGKLRQSVTTRHKYMIHTYTQLRNALQPCHNLYHEWVERTVQPFKQPMVLKHQRPV